jgi:Protein of unknown function DUF262
LYLILVGGVSVTEPTVNSSESIASDEAQDEKFSMLEAERGEDEEEGGEPYEPETFQYDPDKINIDIREPTIDLLLKRIDEEALDLAPEFQRQADIWKDDVKSRLIESILIRIPLPAFYIDATDEEQWLVVDGLQRLSALKKFVKDKTLKLSGLEYLKELEGKNYDELERRYQRRIEETQVTVYLIKPGTPIKVKYNIFKRINTGGVPLSPQELRHALGPVEGTRFLKKLAESEEFKKVISLNPSRTNRMEDREFVLGFLAFYLTSYKDYRNNTRDFFLGEALDKIKQIGEEQRKSIERSFKEAMLAALQIFGENAFRKISKNKSRKYPVNKGLFEAWSVNLSRLKDEEIKTLIEKKQILIEKFSDRVDTDREFLTSISQAAYKVDYRFSTIETIIQEVLLP